MGDAKTSAPAAPPLAARFGQLISGASLLAVIYILDKAGVFAAMKGKGPLTIEEIAEVSGCKVRLLRESLAAMAGAGYVTYAGEGRFELNEEQSALLVDPIAKFGEKEIGIGAGGMAGWGEMMHGLYNVLPALADSMKKDGPPGVHFTAYGSEFPHGLARMRAGTLIETVPLHILPQMNLSPLLEKGVKCADVGCGTGLFSISLASRFPNSTVRGFDVDNNSIERAKKNLEAAGAKNASFEVRSLYELDKFDELFDLIFAFDMIHDLNDPVLGLQAIRKSLKPGGMLVMMEPKVAEKFEDSLTPETAVLYAISTLHCVPQSLAGGGPGLGAAWGKAKAEELAKEAGFAYFEEREVKVPGFFQGMYVAGV